jgi:hypothetical protein
MMLSRLTRSIQFMALTLPFPTREVQQRCSAWAVLRYTDGIVPLGVPRPPRGLAVLCRAGPFLVGSGPSLCLFRTSDQENG